MALETLQWHLGLDGRTVEDAELEALAREASAFGAELVLVFADVRHFKPAELTGGASAVERLLKAFAAYAPAVALAGCSTAGEIHGQAVHTGTMSLTALRLQGGHITAHSLPVPAMEASAAVGQALAQAVRQAAQPRHLWVLAPGVKINGSALVDGLKAGFADTTLPGISGGLAADGGAFRQTWTVGPAGATEDHVVALALNGPGLVSGSTAQGGWEAFGPARRVTRVEGNVLFEMDREPALEVYRRYLGEYARDLPASGLLFPLQITEGEDSGLIRTILGIDEAAGALVLAGDLPAQCRVRLMHASAHHLVQAAEDAALALDETAAGGAAGEHGLALLVSCVGRRIVMGDQTDEEVEVVADALPAGACIAGFYSNGEIAAWHFSGDCRLHNQTMTITWLSEVAAADPRP